VINSTSSSQSDHEVQRVCLAPKHLGQAAPLLHVVELAAGKNRCGKARSSRFPRAIPRADNRVAASQHTPAAGCGSDRKDQDGSFHASRSLTTASFFSAQTQQPHRSTSRTGKPLFLDSEGSAEISLLQHSPARGQQAARWLPMTPSRRYTASGISFS
jgi:hypothetical protein